MADIELVIKIEEELYDYMQTDEYDEHLEKRFDYQIRLAVEDGTPLPKGHGDLIDRDALEYEIGSIEGYSELDYEEITREDIEQEPVIIRADKAESEG